MNDKGLSVLEQYDLKVLRCLKGRGAIILDTAQGLKVLREASCATKKVQFQDRVLAHMKSMGVNKIDCFVKNKEGGLISRDKDGAAYVVKDWFEGRECDVRDMTEVKRAVKNLACLHRCMQLGPLEEIRGEYNVKICSLQDELEKHTRELKKVRRFIRDKGQKSGFEVYYIRYYNIFYESALKAMELLPDGRQEEICREIVEKGLICHGDYNYHNIIMEKQGIATINFEKLLPDLQVRDLYQFMRKILEKSDWDITLGMEMLKAYEDSRPLSDMERESLRIRLTYPEKFWKISNYYQSSNKALMPEKNTEKLIKLVAQEAKRQEFLEALAAGS